MEKSADTTASINSVMAQQLITNALVILWPDGIRYIRVKLLISDMASYFTFVARMLQNGLFPDMLHITCKCHALHNCCEKMKADRPNASKLVSILKKSFAQSRRRRHNLQGYIDDIWPTDPSKTRWGSWMPYCAFINKHYRSINNLLSSELLDGSDGCLALDEARELLNDRTELELSEIYAMKDITVAITKLEARDQTVFERKKIIDDIIDYLPPTYSD